MNALMFQIFQLHFLPLQTISKRISTRISTEISWNFYSLHCAHLFKSRGSSLTSYNHSTAASSSIITLSSQNYSRVFYFPQAVATAACNSTVQKKPCWQTGERISIATILINHSITKEKPGNKRRRSQVRRNIAAVPFKPLSFVTLLELTDEFLITNRGCRAVNDGKIPSDFQNHSLLCYEQLDLLQRSLPRLKNNERLFQRKAVQQHKPCASKTACYTQEHPSNLRINSLAPTLITLKN